MVPILQSITDNADDETFVTLVCCFKTFEGIYLKTFLQEQARFWNVRTFFILSQVSLGWWLPSLRLCSHLAPILRTSLFVPCCANNPCHWWYTHQTPGTEGGCDHGLFFWGGGGTRD